MTRPTRPVRSDRRRAVALGTLLTAALGIAGCSSNNGQAEAQQACRTVDQSITLFQRSQQDPSDDQSATETATALEELRTGALPLASQAAGNNPEWQALATDLEESSRVPEGDLVSSLEQQCELADNTSPVPSNGDVGSSGGSAVTSGPSGSSTSGPGRGSTTTEGSVGSATTVGPTTATTIRTGTAPGGT